MKKITKPRRQVGSLVGLRGGPYAGCNARLSGYALHRTLSFSARGQRGHYSSAHDQTSGSMVWVAE